MNQEALHSLAFGAGTQDHQGRWLEVLYPHPVLEPSPELVAACTGCLDCPSGNQVLELSPVKARELAAALARVAPDQARLLESLSHGRRPVVAVMLASNQAPATIPEAYLKLHLLSHRLCRPHDCVLDGLFALLPTVAWTSHGPIAISELAERQLQLRLAGDWLRVHSVDKFPRMCDYVVPDRVRIADSARIRLGAYLGEGTTVMHEGFINFNAGTEGPAMVEGRLSAGVMAGAGSDLGGGSSTMGTLSGGNQSILSVGRNCLIGANAGIGISLGDHCTVEAGLYVTAGSVVTVRDAAGKVASTTKALHLSGQDHLLFRRNSQSGTMECLTRRSATELNKALHEHN